MDKQNKNYKNKTKSPQKVSSQTSASMLQEPVLIKAADAGIPTGKTGSSGDKKK